MGALEFWNMDLVVSCLPQLAANVPLKLGAFTFFQTVDLLVGERRAVPLEFPFQA